MGPHTRVQSPIKEGGPDSPCTQTTQLADPDGRSGYEAKPRTDNAGHRRKTAPRWRRESRRSSETKLCASAQSFVRGVTTQGAIAKQRPAGGERANLNKPSSSDRRRARARNKKGEDETVGKYWQKGRPSFWRLLAAMDYPLPMPSYKRTSRSGLVRCITG